MGIWLGCWIPLVWLRLCELDILSPSRVAGPRFPPKTPFRDVWSGNVRVSREASVYLGVYTQPHDDDLTWGYIGARWPAWDT